MDRIYRYFSHKLKETSTKFLRYRFDDIHWDGRAFGIVGPRGVGKTTMLLQYIKLHLSLSDTLYVSADHLYFADHSLIDLADAFSKSGGKHLFIDEIHKYEGWSRELKQIYDTYADMQIVISGSSILDIYRGMADLSRRFPIYDMQGLSFREYLQLFHGLSVPVFSLEDILSGKAEIPSQPHPLPLFNDYLRRGYYPFGKDVDYEIEIGQVIRQTLEVDIPRYAGVNVSTGRKLEQLLMVVAKSVPFKPVMQRLADATGLGRNNIADYLLYIERAGMVAQLRSDTEGIRGLGKVDKLYLDNTNLIYALTPDRADIGNVRETFFYNQMRVRHEVTSSSVSDFEIAGRTFEIGGRKKGNRQISDVPEGYVVKDDVELAYGNVIPLWAFGLTY